MRRALFIRSSASPRSISSSANTALRPFAFAFFIFVAVGYVLARRPVDFFDGFQFLLQALRRVHSDYTWLEVDWYRPRAWVALLQIFAAGFHRAFGVWPAVADYHRVALVVAAGYVVLAQRLVAAYTDDTVGNFTAAWLALHAWVWHYGATALADLFAGAIWFATGLAWFRMERARGGSRVGWFLAAVLAGTLASHAKHYLFFLFPLFLLLRGEWRGLTVGLVAWGFASAGLVHFSAGPDFSLRHWARFLRGFLVVNAYQPGQVAEPWFYLRALFAWSGAALPVAAVFAAIGARAPGRWRGDAASHAFLATTAVAGALVQIGGHKEIRYLFPFLPALIALIAYPLAARWASGSPAWRALIAVAWLTPGIHAIQTWRAEVPGPEYAALPARCREFRVRRIDWRPPHDAFALDPQYARYVIGPDLVFHTAKPIRYEVHRPPGPVGEAELRGWLAETAPEECRVFSRADSSAREIWVYSKTNASPALNASIVRVWR